MRDVCIMSAVVAVPEGASPPPRVVVLCTQFCFSAYGVLLRVPHSELFWNVVRLWHVRALVCVLHVPHGMLSHLGYCVSPAWPCSYFICRVLNLFACLSPNVAKMGMTHHPSHSHRWACVSYFITPPPPLSPPTAPCHLSCPIMILILSGVPTSHASRAFPYSSGHSLALPSSQPVPRCTMDVAMTALVAVAPSSTYTPIIR